MPTDPRNTCLTSFRFPPEVDEKLDALARRSGASRTKTLIRLIEQSSEGVDRYLAQVAAVQSFVAAVTATVVLNKLDPAGAVAVQDHVLKICDDMFGDLPEPPVQWTADGKGATYAAALLSALRERSPH